VRKLLLLVGACVCLGAGGGSLSAGTLPDMGRVRDLLVSIFEDVDAIFNSFSGGPDDPKGPVRDQTALNEDSSRLAAARHKADQLAVELSKLRTQTGNRAP
jgi:hypothetical protein